MLGESGNTVSITELANGEERVVNVVEDESLGGFCGEAWEGKGSNGGGKDESAIGQQDRDGIMAGGHIGKAGCGGRKEMASGAGVSNGRARNYRQGRGSTAVGVMGSASLSGLG